MQNMGTWAWSMMGTTLDASSEVQPTTAMRLEWLAIICWAAGTASAGSPRVSNCWQPTVWAMILPPLLMARDAADERGGRVDGAGARASTSAPREHQSEPGQEEPDAVTDPMTSTSCLHQVPPLADGCRRLIVDDRSDNHGS